MKLYLGSKRMNQELLTKMCENAHTLLLLLCIQGTKLSINKPISEHSIVLSGSPR